MKEILNTMAKTESGELIHVNAAIKGKPYFCPVCNQEMILRKRKEELRRRRPHFAHKVITSNCSPESALHYLFKKTSV